MNTPTSSFGHTDHYEFTVEENHHVDRLRFVLFEISLLSYGIGSLMLALGYHLPGTAGWIAWAVGGFFLLLGAVYYHPLRRFKRVTKRYGDDVNNVMVALDDLRTAFRTGSYVVGVLNALILAFIILLLF